MEEKSTSMVILGIVAIVAIIGLVMLFQPRAAKPTLEQPLNVVQNCQSKVVAECADTVYATECLQRLLPARCGLSSSAVGALIYG